MRTGEEAAMNKVTKTSQRAARRSAMRGLDRGVLAMCAGLAWIAFGGAVYADTTSTNPAGLIIFPRIVFDSAQSYDTEVQISNTSGEAVRVRCYLVNANSHCSNAPDEVCDEDQDCGPVDCGLPGTPPCGICLPGWTETDFVFTLTRYQPIMWRTGVGLASFPLDGINVVGPDGEFNVDSNIPPAPEDPFKGELKCFQVDANDNPVARNDLKGEATFVQSSEELDAYQYNAVGLLSTGVNDGNDILCLGGTEATEECPEPEYNGCPSVLILNHFFAYAPEPVNGDIVQPYLQVVPCSEDFLNQSVTKSTLQFLVFNEYEQRFSTSRRVDCYYETRLVDIDTRPGMEGDQASIFSIDVQGTLVGQTRIRPVRTDETTVGHGWVGIAREIHFATDVGEYQAAAQLHHTGISRQGDIIRAPRE
jgi:hypothetical protein